MSGRNLHSHDIRAHIAQGWEEVSSFGQGGQGDEGDNFRIVCETKSVGDTIYG